MEHLGLTGLETTLTPGRLETRSRAAEEASEPIHEIHGGDGCDGCWDWNLGPGDGHDWGTGGFG